MPALRWFVRGYLGLRTDGVHHVPRGPALFVSNHNGGMIGPDLPCTLSVLWERQAKGAETTREELLRKYESEYTGTADRMTRQLLDYAKKRSR